MRSRRSFLEAAIAAVTAAALSMIVFTAVFKWIATGWAGGDMLSTYLAAELWQGFNYQVSEQFGFPLGMNLNYFPGIDITENLFAQTVTNLTGRPFVGINVLIMFTFPLVAFGAYFLFRMVGLTGALAITGAVVFSLLPYHFGRALGHTYLSTLYSAVTGMALVLLVGSGRFEQLTKQLLGKGTRTSKGNGKQPVSTKRRWSIGIGLALLIVITAWTGVYYVAFTLILGAAALIWRFAHRARIKDLLVDAIPFASVAALAIVGFIPGLLTTRADPPLAQLSERMPIESVTFAGNLSVALLPIPQSSLPGGSLYNNAVLEAIAAAGWGESTAITNHGTWITALSLLVIVIALIMRTRRPQPIDARNSNKASLNFVVYLIFVALAFFVPWGLNYLFAGTVTAQIRAWNRLTPILLLLFLLGAAAAIHRTRLATNMRFAIPISVVILALTALDSVLPFRSAYAVSASESAEITKAGVQYAAAVNAAIPEKCGILQLPHMGYPEAGRIGEINDYDHFWTSITNNGKQWSYGAVKNTDAGIWASQLPELPTDEQLTELANGGFCAIHLDTRGFITEKLPAMREYLTNRLGLPLATGFDGKWELYAIPTAPTTNPEQAFRFFHPAFITPDLTTLTLRDSSLDQSWWWARDRFAIFTLTPITLDAPISTVTGAIGAPSCGPRPVRITIKSDTGAKETTVIATPDQQSVFELTLPAPTNKPITLTIDSQGTGCAEGPPNPAGGQEERYAQIFNLAAK